MAEAFEAGAEGAEEVDLEAGYRACVYGAEVRIESIRAALQRVASAETEIGSSERVPDVDWTEAWKEGLEALRISSRLVVRPPFIAVDLEPGQREVVIDPGQAFGTGAHASTRLCLDWIDALYATPAGRARHPRVLDVGTGSGVLAFAALVLGAESAVGFDLDPVAIEAAEVSARENGLAQRVRLLAAPIEALDDDQVFPLVVANLLKREILPIAGAVADRVEAGGHLLLSGLLAEDAPEVCARFAQEGLAEAAPARAIDDATGTWVGLCLEKKATIESGLALR